MKTNYYQSIKLAITMVVATVTVGWLADTAIAAETGSARGGAALLMQGRPAQTAKDVATVKEGDLAAMSCPKCKTVTVKRVTLEKGHIPQTSWVQNHQCPGCSSKFEVTGHGRMKKAGIVHTCTECGGKSAFCCAVTPDAGPTPGMEEK